MRLLPSGPIEVDVWRFREAIAVGDVERAARLYSGDLLPTCYDDARMRDAEMVDAFSRAIEASPNFAYAHGLLGAAHALGGRPDQAKECIDRGVRLSPRDIFGDEYQLYYAFAHFQAGRYPGAAAAAYRAIHQRPGHPVPYIMAAASHGLAGEIDQAATTITRLRELVPGVSAADPEENFPYCRQEDRSRLARGLRAGGLPERPTETAGRDGECEAPA